MQATIVLKSGNLQALSNYQKTLYLLAKWKWNSIIRTEYDKRLLKITVHLQLSEDEPNSLQMLICEGCCNFVFTNLIQSG